MILLQCPDFRAGIARFADEQDAEIMVILFIKRTLRKADVPVVIHHLKPQIRFVFLNRFIKRLLGLDELSVDLVDRFPRDESHLRRRFFRQRSKDDDTTLSIQEQRGL